MTNYELLLEVEKDFDFSPSEYVDEDTINNITDIEEMREYLELINEDKEVTDTEIIYFASAMEYLKKNDPSLTESLRIANDY